MRRIVGSLLALASLLPPATASAGTTTLDGRVEVGYYDTRNKAGEAIWFATLCTWRVGEQSLADLNGKDIWTWEIPERLRGLKAKFSWAPDFFFPVRNNTIGKGVEIRFYSSACALGAILFRAAPEPFVAIELYIPEEAEYAVAWPQEPHQGVNVTLKVG